MTIASPVTKSVIGAESREYLVVTGHGKKGWGNMLSVRSRSARRGHTKKRTMGFEQCAQGALEVGWDSLQQQTQSATAVSEGAAGRLLVE